MDHAPLKRGDLPPPPAGVNAEKWGNTLLALKAVGMPVVELQRLRTLRQANLYTWMCVILGNDWKLIREFESMMLAPGFKPPANKKEWEEMVKKL